MSKAIIVVDVQNDFVEGGALGVEGGLRVSSRVADHLRKHADDYEAIIYTKDWHIEPEGHFSDTPDFESTWPVHCVAETDGAELHKSVGSAIEELSSKAVGVHKGEFTAAYSGFEGTVEEVGSAVDGIEKKSTVVDMLEELGVMELDIVGIATDHCVRLTARDAMFEGFQVNVLTEMIAGVDPDASTATLVYLQALGANLK